MGMCRYFILVSFLMISVFLITLGGGSFKGVLLLLGTGRFRTYRKRGYLITWHGVMIYAVFYYCTTT
jgi:hypothetical protein